MAATNTRTKAVAWDPAALPGPVRVGRGRLAVTAAVQAVGRDLLVTVTGGRRMPAPRLSSRRRPVDGGGSDVWPWCRRTRKVRWPKRGRCGSPGRPGAPAFAWPASTRTRPLRRRSRRSSPTRSGPSTGWPTPWRACPPIRGTAGPACRSRARRRTATPGARAPVRRGNAARRARRRRPRTSRGPSRRRDGRRRCGRGG